MVGALFEKNLNQNVDAVVVVVIVQMIPNRNVGEAVAAVAVVLKCCSMPSCSTIDQVFAQVHLPLETIDGSMMTAVSVARPPPVLGRSSPHMLAL